MNAQDRAAVRSMLEAHNTLTLATSADGRPWAASVFFASDSRLNLYFVSDRRTRHGRDIAAAPVVAAAVNPDCSRWGDVRGLQIEGRVDVVTGIERLNALRIYLAKFHDVRALFENPETEDERTIAERLKAANLYRLTPTWIRLIDNSRWFGYKAEFDLDPDSAD